MARRAARGLAARPPPPRPRARPCRSPSRAPRSRASGARSRSPARRRSRARAAARASARPRPPRRRRAARAGARARPSCRRSCGSRPSSPSPVHEAAVDLERVDRQPLEVGERRVARAEVVDAEHDPEPGEALEQRPGCAPGRPSRPTPSPRARGRRSPARAPAARRPRRRRSAWSARAERFTATGMRSPPAAHAAWSAIAVRSTHSVSGRIRPVCSASSMNCLRRHEPVARARPADERLDAGQLARAQVELGLVVEHQLARGDRLAQARRERQPRRRVGAHLGLVGGPWHALRLGRAQGDVGAPQQRLGVRRRAERDPGDDAHVERQAGGLDRRLERRLGARDRGLGAGRVAQQRERIAAGARDRLRRARPRPPAGRRPRAARRRRRDGRARR